MRDRTGRRAMFVVLAVIAVAAAVASSCAAGSRASGSFPCSWKWDLEAGFRAGYVTAVNSANCAGRSGSLTLSVRLLRWNPKTRKWHLDKAQTRTFADLHSNRYLGLAERCSASTMRAEFGWILRDSGGSVVARHSIKSGTLKVPGPDCRIVIG